MNKISAIRNILEYIKPVTAISSIIFIFFGIKIFVEGIYISRLKEKIISIISGITLIITSV